MRFLQLASALTSLAASVSSASSPRAVDAPITYDGYKVYRVSTDGNTDALKETLSALKYDEWNNDAGTLDIALSPDQESAFRGLGLDFKVLHENLGNSIKDEARAPATANKWKRQATDLSWYDSYHTYGDHIKYVKC